MPGMAGTAAAAAAEAEAEAVRDPCGERRGEAGAEHVEGVDTSLSRSRALLLPPTPALPRGVVVLSLLPPVGVRLSEGDRRRCCGDPGVDPDPRGMGESPRIEIG
jgi:hypothetical protein